MSFITHIGSFFIFRKNLLNGTVIASQLFLKIAQNINRKEF